MLMVCCETSLIDNIWFLHNKDRSYCGQDLIYPIFLFPPGPVYFRKLCKIVYSIVLLRDQTGLIPSLCSKQFIFCLFSVTKVLTSFDFFILIIMSEVQAMVEFSVELHKFFNVDLFHSG